MVVRHRPDDDLNLIIHLGSAQRLLFTVRTGTKKPEAIFIALVIGSFLDAFAGRAFGRALAGPFRGGCRHRRQRFRSGSSKATRVAQFFQEALKDKPVATARIIAKGW